MPKLLMLSGPSGSGKSFKARQLLEADGNAVRINRDSIREMSILKWSPAREGWIIDAELAMTDAAARGKRNVIIDDTNLRQRDEDRWRYKAKELGYEFQKIQVTASLAQCILQDAHREGKARVGRIVIEKQFLQAGLVEWPADKQVVIFDIDGTLGDLEHRVPWITIGATCPSCMNMFADCAFCENGKIVKKNYDRFYSDVMNDKPIDIVVRWAQECIKHFCVLIVSGRSPEKCDQSTLDWLCKHKIPFDHIYMRRYNMHGPDYEEKELILKDILKVVPKEKIAFVVDDRPSVVTMWRRNGLRVIPVRGRDDDPFYSYDSEYEKQLTEEAKNEKGNTSLADGVGNEPVSVGTDPSA